MQIKIAKKKKTYLTKESSLLTSSIRAKEVISVGAWDNQGKRKRKRKRKIWSKVQEWTMLVFLYKSFSVENDYGNIIKRKARGYMWIIKEGKYMVTRSWWELTKSSRVCAVWVCTQSHTIQASKHHRKLRKVKKYLRSKSVFPSPNAPK